MGSENRFVYAPSTVDIGRSKFIMNSFWKGSLYHGYLYPVEITRVMPGDSAKYNISAFIRTATPPISPFMDSIKLSFAAFYVPERLVWSKEKNFVGENTEGYGIQTEVLAPRSSSPTMTIPVSEAATTYKKSIGTALGLVRQKISGITNYSPIALNPIRCVLQVYNDWFRNENFMSPYLWNHDLTGDNNQPLATRNGTNYLCTSDLPRVCKQLDRFTSCLPFAQKGSPVTLGIGGYAPIVGSNSFHSTGEYDPKFGWYSETSGTVVTQPKVLGIADDGRLGQALEASAGALTNPQVGALIDATNLVADLGSATATSVNQLRLAFATQKYLEQLARTGSKYREYIKGMFGVSIGDTTAQMAEYLGGFTMELNIDQVLQTTGFAADGTTKLGAPGAVSCSANSDYLFTKSFTEPGFIVIVAYTKHNRTYGQGIDDIYFKHEILEEYNPKFANVGEEAIKKSLLYFTGDASDDNTRLGFQEKWSEYRHKKDIVVGELCPSNTGSMNTWSLADNYASAPVLNEEFLTEDRSAIARCLAGGESSPDYFLDIKFNREFVRPMPLYSIPGLVDHH